MYQKTVLENGIRVITEQVHGMRSVAIGVIVDAGPRDETNKQTGLAHLTEHLMFQGTSSRNAMQISRLMDIAGGNMGGFTTRDYTGYVVTVLDDNRTYVLDLLGDILLNSTFPPDKLEREQQAILHEIEAGYDSPSERVHDNLKSFIWANHQLGKPITGWPETVNSLTREDIIYFVHEHYTPNRIIIAAAGNVEHRDFVAQVRDSFWRMLGKGIPTDKVIPEYQSGLNVEHIPVSQAYFSIGFQAFPYNHPDRYNMHVLSNVLGGGISSRLFCRVREERGLVYDIGTEYHAYRDGGLMIVEGSTSPEYLIPVLGLTMVELWQLIAGEEPVDDEELWKTKMHIRGQHLIDSESTSTRMSRLATQELYFGRHITDDEILSEIEAVDNEQLQRISNETLIEALQNVAISVVGPEAPEHYSIKTINEMLDSFK